MINQQTYTSTVLNGARRATELGYPTVNIFCDDDSLSGVYAGMLTYDGTEYQAAIFADPVRQLLEAHAPDLNQNLYGQTVSITPFAKLRDKQPFTNDEELKVMIKGDVEAMRQYFTE